MTTATETCSCGKGFADDARWPWRRVTDDLGKPWHAACREQFELDALEAFGLPDDPRRCFGCEVMLTAADAWYCAECNQDRMLS